MSVEQREQLDEATGRLEALRGTLALLMEAKEIGPAGRLAFASIDYAIADIGRCIDSATSFTPPAVPS